MTDNEIKKALELCTDDGLEVCVNCAYQKYKMGYEEGCTYYLLKDTLDLINRQQAEIELLTEKTNAYAVNLTIATSAIHSLKADVKTTKAESIKEFAEQVKAQTMLDNAFVDNLVKEMVGENR